MYSSSFNHPPQCHVLLINVYVELIISGLPYFAQYLMND